MRDPTRITDPRSSSPEAVREIIQAGRSEMPDEARLRGVGDRLGFGLGSAAGSAAAGKGALGKGAVGLLGGTSAKIGAAIAIVATAGAALTTLGPSWRRESVAALPAEQARPPVESPARGAGIPDPPVASSIVPPTRQDVPVPSSPAQRLVARPAAVRPAIDEPKSPPSPEPEATATPPSVPTPTPATPPTETEFSLLEQAQRALGDDPKRALSLADRDGRLYPTGVLAQEREVIAIEALMMLGRSDEARQRADAFSRSFPGSAHTPRILQLVDPTRGLQ